MISGALLGMSTIYLYSYLFPMSFRAVAGGRIGAMELILDSRSDL